MVSSDGASSAGDSSEAGLPEDALNKSCPDLTQPSSLPPTQRTPQHAPAPATFSARSRSASCHKSSRVDDICSSQKDMEKLGLGLLIMSGLGERMYKCNYSY